MLPHFVAALTPDPVSLLLRSGWSATTSPRVARVTNWDFSGAPQVPIAWRQHTAKSAALNLVARIYRNSETAKNSQRQGRTLDPSTRTRDGWLSFFQLPGLKAERCTRRSKRSCRFGKCHTLGGLGAHSPRDLAFPLSGVRIAVLAFHFTKKSVFGRSERATPTLLQPYCP